MHVLCSVCVDLLYDRDIILHRVRAAQEGFHFKHGDIIVHSTGGSYSKHRTTCIILHCGTQHKGNSTLHRVIILHRGNTIQGDYTSKPGLLYYIVHGDHTPKRAIIFCFGIRAQGGSHSKHMAVILHRAGVAPHLVFLLPSPWPSCSCDLIPPSTA